MSRCPTIVSTCALLLLSSCRDTTVDKETALEFRMRGHIAFIGAGAHDPLWPVLKAGGERFQSSSATMEMRIMCPTGDSARAQAELLAGLDDPDLRGICIQIRDPEAVSPLLSRLHTRGVVIVSMVEPAPEGVRYAHVGLDDMAVGQELAACVADALGERGGSIMVLHAGLKRPVLGPRYLAFAQAIQRNSQVAVLAEIDCQADPGEARRIIAERSRRYPRLDAWVAMDDWPLQDGTPVEEVFPPGMRYMTVGGTPRHWTLIREGRCPCVVAADYGQIGVRAAQLCISAVRDPLQDRRTYYIPLRRLKPATLDAFQNDWMEWMTVPERRP